MALMMFTFLESQLNSSVGSGWQLLPLIILCRRQLPSNGDTALFVQTSDVLPQ